MSCGATAMVMGKEVFCELRKGHKGMHKHTVTWTWGNLKQYEQTQTEKEVYHV
jgi:hypothetical protein